MIKNISKYPQQTSPECAAPVRKVDENILTIVQNLKDTIDENSIKALAAYQIGSPYNIIVIKQDDGTFLELLNPLLISRDGEQTNNELTAYFGELTAKVTRADKISIVYEDLDMKEHYIKAEGEYSALLQRKIDYTFGSSFINKLSKDEKKLFENKLEFGVEAAMVGACPTNYKRDYISKGIDYLIIAMVLIFGISFFIDTPLFIYEIYLTSIIIILNITYFIYAQYEAKQYGSCTNCQIGDILGTMAILMTRTSAVFIASYFFM
jgi:peptide deformylase